MLRVCHQPVQPKTSNCVVREPVEPVTLQTPRQQGLLQDCVEIPINRCNNAESTAQLLNVARHLEGPVLVQVDSLDHV